MKKQLFTKLGLVAVFVLATVTAGVCAPPPPDVPFDGGISLLIGGGIFLAIRKFITK